MTGTYSRSAHRGTTGAAANRWLAGVTVATVASSLVLIGLLTVSSSAAASEAPVKLGTSKTYSVLGGSTVTNTGPTRLEGDLGLSPGSAITGFPPGVAEGETHAGDAVAAQAQSDLVIASNDAAGRAPTGDISGDLGGQTLPGGVYKSTGPIGISGTLTLDGQNDPSSVFIFQIASTLITASASKVAMINGAQACHVYWQVGSSATLGTNSALEGNILADQSVTLTTGASLAEGRALALVGAVTMDTNQVSAPEADLSVTKTTPAGPVVAGNTIT